MFQIGQVLCDRYELQQKLGQNSGRQTWLAVDRDLEPPEPVIVKLLAFSEQTHWDDLKLFEREAQVLKQLNHPQIPKYRDSFTFDDRISWFALVQNYVPGSSLKDLLAEGKRFTEAQVRQIVINILYILSYLHELSPPVLHRDIKPSNLIWGEDNYIYLIDFGAVQDRATREGSTFTVVGTYGYTPLEQFGGRAVPASDLYALGASIIHLLTGTSPADLPHVDLRVQFADRISIDPHFVRWIQVLTEPDPTKRFATAREALAALQFEQADACTSLQAANPSALPPAPQYHQSQFSGIQLSRNDDELLIQIPGPSEWYVLFLLILLSSIGTLLSLGFLPGFLLILVPAFAPILLTHWYLISPTFVEFDRHQFTIYKKLLDFSLPLSKGNTFDIEAVFHTLKTFQPGRNSYEKRVVMLQTQDKEHYFGEELSREACAWLVEEIKDWLELR
jgi:serine/threonine protein kinase